MAVKSDLGQNTMRDKRYILLLVLLAFFVTVSEAQKSANATMRVSVNIVNSVSANADAQSNLSFDESGIQGEIGSISLSGLGDKEVLVTSQKEMYLVNTEGHRITLPISTFNKRSAQQTNLKFSSSEGSYSGGEYKGIYSGTLTTTIEYL